MINGLSVDWATLPAAMPVAEPDPEAAVPSGAVPDAEAEADADADPDPDAGSRARTRSGTRPGGALLRAEVAHLGTVVVAAGDGGGRQGQPEGDGGEGAAGVHREAPGVRR